MTANKVRLGVVGLGRCWEARYQPTLARLRDRFVVTAVFDQVARRSEIVANQVRGWAAEGVAALLASPAVDAVAILAPQWFGSYALEAAARAGKPILTALALPEPPAELDQLDALIRASGVPVLPDFALRFDPAATRLRELFPPGSGAPVRIRVVIPAASAALAAPTDPAASPIHRASLPALVAWARDFVATSDYDLIAWPDAGDQPIDPDSRRSSVTFAEVGRAGEARAGIEVWAGHRRAWWTEPDRLRWSDGGPTQEESVAPASAGADRLFDQFHRLILGQEPAASSWNDALTAARLAASIRERLRQGGGLIAHRPRPATDAPGPEAPR